MTTTLNSSYISNPVTVGQGGTGVASLTAYGLIAAGTTATGAFQSGGDGTSNQIYVSGGSAALGTQTSNDKVGTWQLISTQPASNVASIAFTGLSTSYEVYKFILYNVTPVTGSAHLGIQFSSNNGSSYQTGSTAYYYGLYTLSDANTASPANGNIAYIPFDNDGITTTNLANYWEITFTEPDTSLTGNGVTFIGKYDDSTNGTVMVVGQGRYNGTQATNAVQFSFSSGNINTGTFNLYGMLT